MARGINQAILVGFLGADPTIRHDAAGAPIATLSIATSEQWIDKRTGQKQERTEWHRVTLFDRLAEIAGEYLKKSNQVYIEGSVRTEKYQDKATGQDRWSTSIIAKNMQLLGNNTSTRTEQAERPVQEAAEAAPAAEVPKEPADIVPGGTPDAPKELPVVFQAPKKKAAARKKAAPKAKTAAGKAPGKKAGTASKKRSSRKSSARPAGTAAKVADNAGTRTNEQSVVEDTMG